MRFFRLNLVACALVFPIMNPDAMSLIHAWHWKHVTYHQTPAFTHIDSSSMRDALMPPSEREVLQGDHQLLSTMQKRRLSQPQTAYEMTLFINDGLQLIRPHLDQASRVMGLVKRNFFNFAFKQPPPVGDAVHWVPHQLSKDGHPDPARVFGSVTHIMRPNTNPDADPTLKRLLEIYGDYIKDHYKVAERSALWTLYVRH